MKKIRLDLQFFGESGEGCAAEQSVAAADQEVSRDANAKEPDTSSFANVSPEPRDNAFNRIAELLGINAENEEALIDILRKKRAGAALVEELKKSRAEKAYAKIISESGKLSSKIKGFDLGKELSDHRFTALIRSGFTVEEAWRSVHVNELIEEAKIEARSRALADALNEINLSSTRPDENGGAGKAPAKSQTSVESLTGRGIRDILQRVANGAKIKF